MNSRNDVDVSLLLIEVHNTIQNKRMNEALKKKECSTRVSLGGVVRIAVHCNQFTCICEEK